MKTKPNRYRVIDYKNKNYGKRIKAIPCEDVPLSYVDIETGEIYGIAQLQSIPDRHAAYLGIHAGRVGVFLFGREYWQYKSFQFGISFDWIDGTDRYFDIELRFVCFGIGIRFVTTPKKEK